jgi:plasmid stabilization system protein ParE
MSVRFVLAPQAALDLVDIWRYIKEQTSLTIADRVESAIREKIEFLARRSTAKRKRRNAWNPPRFPAPCSALSELRWSRTRPARVVKR